MTVNRLSCCAICNSCSATVPRLLIVHYCESYFAILTPKHAYGAHLYQLHCKPQGAGRARRQDCSSSRAHHCSYFHSFSIPTAPGGVTTTYRGQTTTELCPLPLPPVPGCSTSRSWQSSPAPYSSNDSSMWWYHQKYGEAAKKCRFPCSYTVPSNDLIGL